MKPEQTDRLKDLFHEMKMEKTSDQFMDNLMLRVKKEAVAKKHKKQYNQYFMISSGIACILVIPALIIYFLGIDIQSDHTQTPNMFTYLASAFKGITINPLIICLGLVILLLLIGDSLIRKYAEKKHAHHQTGTAL